MELKKKKLCKKTAFRAYYLLQDTFSEQHILCDLKIRQVQSNNNNEWQEMLTAS